MITEKFLACLLNISRKYTIENKLKKTIKLEYLAE